MKNKKMIAPIIITVCVVVYLLFYIFMANMVPDMPLLVWVLLSAIPMALIGVMLYVLFQRIDEIKKGEEDDLSKY